MPRKFTPEYYPGAKAQAKVWQQIINIMPPHTTYVEGFLGSGQVLRHKRPAARQYGIEINPAVIDMYRYHYPAGLRVGCGNAIAWLQDHLAELDEHTLIYLDPPYPMASRRDSARAIYEHELTDEQHEELLHTITELNPNRCMIAISSYPNELYDKWLMGWHFTEIETANHAGPATEVVFTNYPTPPAQLHDYRYIGPDTDTRRIMLRQVKRNVRKLAALDPHIRGAILQELATLAQ
jgi:DNA adenine methylase